MYKETSFNREFWERVQVWCTEYKADACKAIAYFNIEVEEESIYYATIDAAKKHFQLQQPQTQIMGMLSHLRTYQRAEELGLTIDEYRNKKIRKDAEHHQQQLFLSKSQH